MVLQCAVSLNYFILFMSVYINATLRPGHPCLDSALTLLTPFYGVRSPGGEEERNPEPTCPHSGSLGHQNCQLQQLRTGFFPGSVFLMVDHTTIC